LQQCFQQINTYSLAKLIYFLSAPPLSLKYRFQFATTQAALVSGKIIKWLHSLAGWVYKL
jgi:hypothetical protein